MFVYGEDKKDDAAIGKKTRTTILSQLWVVVIALFKCSAMALQAELYLYSDDEEEDA